MLDTGRWRDFEAGRGGGAIDLVEYLQGMDRPSALKWLQAKGYLDLRPSQDGTRSPKRLSLSADHRGLRQPPGKASKSTPSIIPWHCRAWGSARSIPLTRSTQPGSCGARRFPLPVSCVGSPQTVDTPVRATYWR